MAEKEVEKQKKLSQTVRGKNVTERNQAYNDYVKAVTPTHNLVENMVKAFFLGGLICCIGQLILNTAKGMGLDQEAAGSWRFSETIRSIT